MQIFFKEHRRMLITILITVLLTFCLPFYWNYIYNSPVDLPISLSPSSSVAIQFTVPHGNEYVLEFIFEREGFSSRTLEELIGRNFYMKKDGFTEEKVQKATGNKYYKTYYAGEYVGVRTGTPIIIHWEIRSLNNTTLIQQDIETLGLDSWGPKHVTRTISQFSSPVPNYTMPNFHLNSGKHELKATILNDTPVLPGIKTNIKLRPNPSKDDFVLRQFFWFALVAIDIILFIILALSRPVQT